MSEWLKFTENKTKGKTKWFIVWSKQTGHTLGAIKWYPAWRHYCFIPTSLHETVYSDRCLEELAEFVEDLNLSHKFEKPPKICKCGHFDLDHEISQVYGLYHCLICKKSCISPEDFKKVPRNRLEEYKKKYKELKSKGVLA